MEIIGALAIMPAFGQRRCAMATFAARDITTTTSACGRISESGSEAGQYPERELRDVWI